MGRYPTEAEGLAALVKEPPGGGRWLGPYLPATAVKGERVVDGAGRPIVYRLEGGKHVLVGAGPDGKLGTGDDVRLKVEDRPRAGEQPAGRKPFADWFGKNLGRA
jgi:general secretion pathway protein G